MSDWTQERLEALGREWQQRLFLGGWKVDFFLVDKAELEDDNMGECHWDASLAYAKVKVANPVTDPHTGTRFEVTDVEINLVHELLHLHTIGLQRPYEEASDYIPKALFVHLKVRSDEAEERLINHVARALVALKRKGGTAC